MSTKNLSTVANEVIEAYGNTARNVIQGYRVGGERMIDFVDQRWVSAINAGTARLNKDVRTNLLDAHKRISGYYVKGLHFGTDRAESFVNGAVDLASKGVERIAANAERFEQASGAIEMVTRIAMPAANAVSQVAERLEKGSSQLVERVAGKRTVSRVKTPAATKAKRTVAKRKGVAKAAAKPAKKAVAARRVARKSATAAAAA